MVDPLRQDIKKLMSEVPQILIENEEMLEILDGRVDNVIKKHKDENMVVASISSDEYPVNAGEVILSAREDMEDDGEIDNEDQITREMAQQLLYQFKLNYDEQTVKDLEQARKSEKTSKKVSRRLQEYDEAKELIEKLKEKFNI